MKNFMKHNFNIKKIAIACFVPPGTGAPVHTNRPYHGLAFYTGGECIFKFDNGKELLVSPKSIIYLPTNSNYTVTRSNKNSGCYAINFDLDEETDFAPFIGACQFHDCSHRKEPGCAVRIALEAGEIEHTRYDSYLRLYEKASQINLWELKK